MVKIGSHVSMSGDLMYYGSVLEAQSYEANTFMIYTGAPQNTLRKPVESLKINEALAQLEVAKIEARDIVVHAPYIINLANPDPVKRAFSVDFLTKEVVRCHAMHTTQMVLHPGNAVAGDLDQAIQWIAEGVQKVIDQTKDMPVRIALETMAGKGTEVGKTFEELKRIIDLIDRRDRVSICFDTCHTHDAGYSIKDDFAGVIKHFDDVIGKEYISVFHVNDSKNVQGARKDRHENFGFGYIGFDALLGVVYHPDFTDIPKILETPYVEGFAPYYDEIKMIKAKIFNPNLKEDIKKRHL